MLSDITVLDFSSTLPGPYCTMILASFGANVIKVERPGTGDAMREWDPWIFSSVNRNKRSITLDLKSERGRETVYRMVKKVDVVVEGFRPGVMKKLGLDFETLKQFNPQLTELLLLDEPSLGLAPIVVEEMFQHIYSIYEQGVTLLLVEQNAHVSLEITQYGFILENGRLVMEGDKNTLVNSQFVKEAYLGLEVGD